MLVSHSLGAQLMAGALRESTVLRERFAREDARAIVFAAPDLDRERFADSVVSRLQSLTERLVRHTSGHDRMLTLGRARSGAARAEQRRDAPLAHPTFETVDATEGLSAENRFAQIFGTHHALRRASSVLFDMIYVVGARRTPECRVALGTGTWRAQTGWELTSLLPKTEEIDARPGFANATSVSRPRPRRHGASCRRQPRESCSCGRVCHRASRAPPARAARRDCTPRSRRSFARIDR